MRLLLLLAAACGAVMAQSVTWIEIAGEWKITQGDQAEWARPDFVDAGWNTIRLPQTFRRTWQGRPLTWFWLRRTIDLPQGDLSLTLGHLVENYEVYLDGVRVARIGDFTAEGSQLARPRTFELPHIPMAHKALLAIRCWRHPRDERPVAFRSSPDTGPYLISSPSAAPRAAGATYLQRLRLRRSPDLALGVSLISIGGMLLLIFAGQRQRRELFWLSCTCFVLASMRLNAVLPVNEDSFPWQPASLDFLCAGTATEFLLAAFAVTSPTFRFVAWALSGWGWLVSGPAAFAGSLVLFPICLMWVAFRTAQRRDLLHGVTLATCFLVAAIGPKASTYLLPATGWWPVPMMLFTGPYEINLHNTAWAVTGMIFIATTVQRLLADSAEKHRLAGELEAARGVQQLLISGQQPPESGYSIDSVYEPAHEVGGDFYQALGAPDGSLLVVVGDVSGKGLKAALTVSMLTGVIRAHSALPPADLLRAMNQVLGVGSGGFVTVIAMRLEPDGNLTAANAGHLAPYIGGVESIIEPGLPLGISLDAEYTACSLRLGPGECMTLMTDGVVEAANAKGVLFGFDRTRDISGKSAQEIAEAAKAWGQNDDITVVTVRRNG